MLIDISSMTQVPLPQLSRPANMPSVCDLLREATERLSPSHAARPHLDKAVAVISISEPAPTPQATRGPTLALWQERRVREHVTANRDRPISTGELIELTRLSTGYFFKAFKATFGVSPHCYIVGQRIEQAKALLADTDEPICGIALACGLNDQSHLSRLFRQVTGTSPGVWRRQHRDPSSGERIDQITGAVTRNALASAV